MPGKMPAIKISPIETAVAAPKQINKKLGGMMEPMQEDATVMAQEKPSS